MTEQTTIGLGSELARRTGGVIISEGVGIVTSIGSLLLVKHVVGEERMAAAKEDVAMHVVLPLLSYIDSVNSKLQNIRSKFPVGRNAAQQAEVQGVSPTLKTAQLLDAEKEEGVTDLLNKASNASGATSGIVMADVKKTLEANGVKDVKGIADTKHLSPEDRARKYADTLLDMTIMAPVGILTRAVSQSWADKKLGAPVIPSDWSFMGMEKTYLMARIPDQITNYVALGAMNTVAKAPSQALSNTMETIFKNLGVKDSSAKNMATYLTYVQTSNMLGNLAGVGYLTAKSRQHMQAALNTSQEPAR